MARCGAGPARVLGGGPTRGASAVVRHVESDRARERGRRFLERSWQRTGGSESGGESDRRHARDQGSGGCRKAPLSILPPSDSLRRGDARHRGQMHCFGAAARRRAQRLAESIHRSAEPVEAGIARRFTGEHGLDLVAWKPLGIGHTRAIVGRVDEETARGKIRDRRTHGRSDLRVHLQQRSPRSSRVGGARAGTTGGYVPQTARPVATRRAGSAHFQLALTTLSDPLSATSSPSQSVDVALRKRLGARWHVGARRPLAAARPSPRRPPSRGRPRCQRSRGHRRRATGRLPAGRA